MKEMEGKEGTTGSIEVHGPELPNGNSRTTDCASDIVSWMSFDVFIEEMNLWSNESVIP